MEKSRALQKSVFKKTIQKRSRERSFSTPFLVYSNEIIGFWGSVKLQPIQISEHSLVHDLLVPERNHLRKIKDLIFFLFTKT